MCTGGGGYGTRLILVIIIQLMNNNYKCTIDAYPTRIPMSMSNVVNLEKELLCKFGAQSYLHIIDL
jgi:hypothetical protein